MQNELITYELLYDILRREKTRVELQKLDKDFYNNIKNYLEEKIKILESLKQKSSIFSEKEIEKTSKEIESIKRLIKELYEKREYKLVQIALSSAKTNNNEIIDLLDEERIFFEKIKEILRNNREETLSLLIEGKPKTIKSENEALLVRFIKSVPKFIGDDLNEYGPFEEEYISLLPIKVAELLISNKRAEKV